MEVEEMIICMLWYLFLYNHLFLNYDMVIIAFIKWNGIMTNQSIISFVYIYDHYIMIIVLWYKNQMKIFWRM